LKIMQASSS